MFQLLWMLRGRLSRAHLSNLLGVLHSKVAGSASAKSYATQRACELLGEELDPRAVRFLVSVLGFCFEVGPEFDAGDVKKVLEAIAHAYREGWSFSYYIFFLSLFGGVPLWANANLFSFRHQTKKFDFRSWIRWHGSIPDRMRYRTRLPPWSRLARRPPVQF
jgi:hypothetical protein